MRAIVSNTGAAACKQPRAPGSYIAGTLTDFRGADGDDFEGARVHNRALSESPPRRPHLAPGRGARVSHWHVPPGAVCTGSAYESLRLLVASTTPRAVRVGRVIGMLR